MGLEHVKYSIQIISYIITTGTILWFELEKLRPSFRWVRTEFDGRLKSLLARNSQEKNAQDLDKWLENKSRAGKNEKSSTLEERIETRPAGKVGNLCVPRTSEKSPNQAAQVNTSYVQRRLNMAYIAMPRVIRENAAEENSWHSNSFSFGSVTGSSPEIRQGTQRPQSESQAASPIPTRRV